jgi:hypothetical protein
MNTHDVMTAERFFSKRLWLGMRSLYRSPLHV